MFLGEINTHISWIYTQEWNYYFFRYMYVWIPGTCQKGFLNGCTKWCPSRNISKWLISNISNKYNFIFSFVFLFPLSFFLWSLSILGILNHFHFSHSGQGLGASLSHFNLHCSDHEWHWETFHNLVDYLDTLPSERLFHFICPFLSNLSVIFLMMLHEFFIYSAHEFLSDMYCRYLLVCTLLLILNNAVLW